MKKTIMLAATLASAIAGSAMAAETPTTGAMKAPAATSAATPSAMSSASLLRTALPGDRLSSKIVGADVHSMSGEKIGDVNDLILDASGKVTGVVVGVGGFLGVGEKSVALSFDAVTMGVDDKGKPRLSVHVTKETLEKAPAFAPAKS